MLNHILDTIRKGRAQRVLKSSPQCDKLDDLPAGLFDYWAQNASRQFPGIPRDALFYARAAEALLMFFDCVGASDKPCALPSKAADSVWHAWLEHAPLTLQQFCRKHYGRLIPHLESAEMPAPMGDALANCLVAARRLARLVPGAANLPPLFQTDRQLGMPHGFLYRIVAGKVALADLDGAGRQCGDLRFPPGLAATALLSCGLVRGWEVPAGRREDGGSCGSVATAGGCDSSDSGGSSCGSGCGGGCGGGS